MKYLDVSVMMGLTMTSVEQGLHDGNDALVFTTTDGRVFKLYHNQDCCESVDIEDIAGDLTNLVGAPFIQSEEVSSDPPARGPDDYTPESETWTFYKFGTTKGYVTVRWWGTSNGYYSESVDFAQFT